MGLSYKKIFLNEKLIPHNSKFAYNCIKYTRDGKKMKNYAYNGVNHICSNSISNEKVKKVFHVSALFDMSPNFSFGPEILSSNSEPRDLANVSILFR